MMTGITITTQKKADWPMLKLLRKLRVVVQFEADFCSVIGIVEDGRPKHKQCTNSFYPCGCSGAKQIRGK